MEESAIGVDRLGPPGYQSLEQANMVADFTPDQVEAIQDLIRDYVRDNLGIILDALKKLEERQSRLMALQESEIIAAHRKELLEDASSPVAGNPEGDVTVVEFFDYQCPYCRKVAPRLERLVSEDRNLRFVFKEWPILGEMSVVAARMALAAVPQGKYNALHRALMAINGQLTQDAIIEAAREVGVDLNQLADDLEDPEIDANLSRNMRLADAIGIKGTPAFVIGDKIIKGAINSAGLKALVDLARKVR